MLKQYPHVEDYIEVIAGTRNPATGKMYSMFDTTPAIINLARYDVAIMDSMAAAVGAGQALTDKQGDLASKLILKYKRQLAVAGIDVTPVENPVYKFPLRIVDRRKILSVVEDSLRLQFPYDTKLIDGVRELAKISHGKWVFHKDLKVWELSITETNVIAAAGFAKNNNFDIHPKFFELEQAVLNCEAIPYVIELRNFNEEEYCIHNGDKNLVQYINDHVGGFGLDNLSKLIDYSSILGYAIDPVIAEKYISSYSTRTYRMMAEQHIKFPPLPDESVYSDIIEYAALTDRWPIYVYEPDLSGNMLRNFVNKYFTPEEVVANSIPADLSGKRVIYFNKCSNKLTGDIPLLISSAGIMHGGEKTMLLQSAEKVIYFANEVYTNVNKLIKGVYVG